MNDEAIALRQCGFWKTETVRVLLRGWNQSKDFAAAVAASMKGPG
jgi:hypothetical protein